MDQEENEIEMVSDIKFDLVRDVLPDDKRDARIDLSLRGDFFTENLGQKSEGAGFYYAQGCPLSVGFGQGWAAYNLIVQDDTSDIGGVLFRTYFVDSNPVEPVGVDMLPHKNNYFIGNDPDKWVTGACNYREIWYYDLWDGIDLKYYFRDGNLKYDFIVNPGGDPDQIILKYVGIDSLSTRTNGDLTIRTVVGDVIDKKPVSFQNDLEIEIATKFFVMDNDKIKFEINHFDPGLRLLIDPAIEFSTFISGSFSGDDWIHGLAVDNDGDILISGNSENSDFPTTIGSYDETFNGGHDDGFIAKLSSDGTGLIFSTFLGGSGTYNDDCTAICVDSFNNPYVTGYTNSDDFPITSGVLKDTLTGASDVILTKLNSSGSKLIYSTYIGGTGGESAADIYVDEDQEVIIYGSTESDDFPTSQNAYDSHLDGYGDIFIIKINNNATNFIYSTFVGGSDSETTVRSFGGSGGMDIDPYGSVYAIGTTRSLDFPTSQNSFDNSFNGLMDCFIIKLKSDLSDLEYSTFLGGGNNDYGLDLEVGENGYIYYCGWTNSSNLPTSSNALYRSLRGVEDGFFGVLSPTFDSVIYLTYFGGSSSNGCMECCRSIETSEDYIFINGITGSSDFYISQDAFDKSIESTAGSNEAYLSIIDRNNYAIKYSTFIGGSNFDFISTPNVIQNNNVYFGITTVSNNFPVTSGSYDTSPHGGPNVAVCKFSFIPLEPKEVHSIRTYSDKDCSDIINRSEIFDNVYIQITGLDGNETTIGKTFISVEVKDSVDQPLVFYLEETDIHSGIYRGNFSLSTTTDQYRRTLKTTLGDEIIVTSIRDNTKKATLLVWGPAAIQPRGSFIDVDEDNNMTVQFTEFGYNEITEWRMDSEEDWIQWNSNDHILYGIPENTDVGEATASMNVTDGLGHFDEVYISINVKNTPPCIQTQNIENAIEDELYWVDYNCDDEGQGDTEWFIEPSLTWLKLDPKSGVLSGIPTNNHVGSYDIIIWVDDGNGGTDSTSFSLKVLDINDPPVITTEPIFSIEQESIYYIQFNALDEDDINIYEWTMTTNAKFLEIDNQTGVLSGKPGNDDVGTHFVNISAKDLRGLSDWLNYSLEVIDANDAPTWLSVPSDCQVNQGEEFTFDAVAQDVDNGDVLSYSITSQPDSDISIDQGTGIITWVGSLEGLRPTPNYVLNVDIQATDGEEMIAHAFTIQVIPNPSPTSTIIGPADGIRVISAGVLLEWEGEDDGEKPLKYDVYLGQSHTDVSMLDRSVLWVEDVKETTIHTSNVEKGKTYYWTVIPKDIYSMGICSNDVFSFSVNIPPSIQEFSIPKAKVGVEFRLNLIGSDLNNDDLDFELVEGPIGMELFNDMLTWTPTVSQIGTHTTNISLYDGYEYVYKEFNVEVEEKEVVSQPKDEGSPFVIIIIVILIVLLLISGGLGAFLFFRKKSATSDEESEKGPPETESLETTADETPSIGPPTF